MWSGTSTKQKPESEPDAPVSSTLWPERRSPRVLGRSSISPAAELWSRGWWRLHAPQCSAFSPGRLGRKTFDARQNHSFVRPLRCQTPLRSTHPMGEQDTMNFRRRLKKQKRQTTKLSDTIYDKCLTWNFINFTHSCVSVGCSLSCLLNSSVLPVKSVALGSDFMSGLCSAVCTCCPFPWSQRAVEESYTPRGFTAADCTLTPGLKGKIHWYKHKSHIIQAILNK